MPFIIVSGTISEETAIEAMKAGASDYLANAMDFYLDRKYGRPFERYGLEQVAITGFQEAGGL